MKRLTKPGFRWEVFDMGDGDQRLEVTAPWGDKTWDYTWNNDPARRDLFLWRLQEKLILKRGWEL